MSPHQDWREVGGADALDVAIPPATSDGLPWLQPLRTRAVLGLTPVVAPAVAPVGASVGASVADPVVVVLVVVPGIGGTG